MTYAVKSKLLSVPGVEWRIALYSTVLYSGFIATQRH